MEKLIIGTRGSALALAQTELVIRQIKEKAPEVECEICVITTKGDKILDKPLVEFGGKGVFVTEIEEKLRRGEIDLAVHSAKDMPMELGEGLAIIGVLKREDPRDVLVTMDWEGFLQKEHPVIGTSSLRRQVQIQQEFPGVLYQTLRGNVNTRLKKLEEGMYDGILLAAAGLRRLGLEKEERFHYHMLDIDRMIPAGGQGIIAVEGRADSRFLGLLESITHESTKIELKLERKALRLLDAGCHEPVGVFTRLEEETEGAIAEGTGNGKMGNIGAEYKKATMSRMVSIWMCREMDGQLKSNMTKVSLERAEMTLKELAENFRRQEGKTTRWNMQKVYLVGAGPGDKELITVKGLKLLKECDVVIYDRLASFELLEEVRADCIKVCVGKEPGRHSMSQKEINGLLVEYGQKYDKVVRLKGGDPFVFGRGGEEAEALQKAGISFELVPGVTSAVAVPECAGIPVTHRGMSQSFHVITGHTKDGEHALTENYHILAGLDGTLVFLMGLGNLKEITERLMAHGKDKATPAAVIEKGTTSEERMVRGTLENIYGKVSRAGLSSPVVILIGKTAALSYGKYQKCEKKTIGITATTGTADKLRSALEREGFHVVETCKMEVEEIREAGQQDKLKAALLRLEEYQWILFTSPNGVRIFFERAQAEGIQIPAGTGLKFAVIGSGSRAALKEYGIEADFIPKTYTSRAFALEFVKQAQSEEKILLPRARQGSRELTRILKEHDYDYEEISLYDVKGSLRVKQEILEKIDCHVFVSASGVKSFFQQIQKLAPGYQFQGNIACIGQVTREEVERQGFSPRILAQVSDVEGLVESIRIYFEKNIEKI